MESAIHCSNLKKSYGSFTLDINDLHIATGTVHGLIGANGCGKTTTIKLLLGLLFPDSGDLSVLGSHAIGQDTEIRQNIGFIVEDASVPSLMNAKQLSDVWNKPTMDGIKVGLTCCLSSSSLMRRSSIECIHEA